MDEEDEPDDVWRGSPRAGRPDARTVVDAREKRCPKCGRGYARIAEVCSSDGAELVEARRVPGDAFIGATIHDRYAIEGVLGRGGMATVYEAIHTGLHKRFAVKILRPDIAFDRPTVERFVQEARIAGSLKHRNLVEVSDFGDVSTDDVPEVAGRRVPFFVMELLRGQTLADAIHDRGHVDAATATEILRQVAEGLAVAHDAGVIHRDLKPDNVFLVREGEAPGGPPVVKILDFGIAKLASSALKLTRPNIVFGTPAYMSPEQMRGDPLDPRTDLYSLGVVLYEALTGRLPFDPDDDPEKRHERPPAIELEGAEPEALALLVPVVMRCLEADRDARFQSASDVVAALVGSRAATPRPPRNVVRVEAPVVADVGVAPPSDRSPRSWRRPLAVLALGGALAVAAVVAWEHFREEAPPKVLPSVTSTARP